MTRVLRGVTSFLPYFGACAILAGVAYASEGDAIVREGGPTFWSLLAIYLALAISCGAAWGLAQPLMRGPVSASLVSALVAWPAAASIMWFAKDRQFRDMTPVDLVIATVLAAIFGPLIAAYQRSKGGET